MSKDVAKLMAKGILSNVRSLGGPRHEHDLSAFGPIATIPSQFSRYTNGFSGGASALERAQFRTAQA